MADEADKKPDDKAKDDKPKADSSAKKKDSDGGGASFWSVLPKLTHNPLGIIGLFISVVYVCITSFFNKNSAQLSVLERQELIWFAIVFAFTVLRVFFVLVVNHWWKLYAPDDFRSDDSFLKPLPSAARDERLREKVETATADGDQAGEAAPAGDKRTAAEVFGKVFGANFGRAGNGVLPEQTATDLVRITQNRALDRLESELGVSLRRETSFGGTDAGFDATFMRPGVWTAVEVKIFPRVLTTATVRELLTRAELARERMQTARVPREFNLLIVLVTERGNDKAPLYVNMVKQMGREAPMPVETKLYYLEDLQPAARS